MAPGRIVSLPAKNMAPFENDLAPEQREIARDIWDALVQNPTPKGWEATREAMLNAPAEVRLAMIHAFIEMCRDGNSPEGRKNPFS